MAIKKLKKILDAPPVLKQMSYDGRKLVIVTVDTNPTAFGWAIGQNDEEGRRFVIRFGARILTEW
jgi:hypothetical protein